MWSRTLGKLMSLYKQGLLFNSSLCLFRPKLLMDFFVVFLVVVVVLDFFGGGRGRKRQERWFIYAFSDESKIIGFSYKDGTRML